MSFVVIVLQILIAIIAVAVAYFKWSFQYWKRRNVQYIEPSIPFGNIQCPLTRSISLGNEIREYYNITKDKGLKYMGIYHLVFPALIIRDLELIKLIMSKDFSNFTDRGTYVNKEADPLSAHLFSLNGKGWRDLRKKLSPTFTTAKMRNMLQSMLDCSFELGKYLDTAKEQVVEMKSLIEKFSTDVIGSCVFGIECNSFKDPNSPFIINSKKIFHPSLFRMCNSVIVDNAQTLSKFFGLRIIDKELSDFFFNLTVDTINYRQQKQVNRTDFMQLLIDMMEKDHEVQETDKENDLQLTVNDIAAQTLLFFLAGFETSSTTISFALFELAQNPDIQQRLRDEIDTILEKYDNKITYDGISEMTYMGQVIDETLRKYPPSTSINRVCTEDWKIPGSDHIIQKGTIIIISLLGIHHDTNYYKDPEKFDPERFTEENKKHRHPFAFIPFGEGPRICIGLRFGIMQTKVGLVTVLKNYKVSLSDKTNLPLKYAINAISLAVENGLWLKLERIDK